MFLSRLQPGDEFSINPTDQTQKSLLEVSKVYQTDGFIPWERFHKFEDNGDKNILLYPQTICEFVS